jgi:hypothetical protein
MCVHAGHKRAITVSTESIAHSSTPAEPVEACSHCGLPLAPDQRYCLECGARREGRPSFFLDVLSARDVGAAPPATAAPPAPQKSRNTTAAIIAGIGVLLLAMGIGVLIGRAGNTKVPAAQVISVSSGGGGATAATPGTGASGTAAPTTGSAAPTTGSSSTTVVDTWPSGTSAYTVVVKALPATATVADVNAAEAAARAKGIAAVGVLNSSTHPGLPPGEYIVYSGVDPQASGASAALVTVKKSFPTATVIHVGTTAGATSGGSTSGSGGSGSGGSGSSGKSGGSSNPGSGGSYEQRSKNLPNVIGT